MYWIHSKRPWENKNLGPSELFSTLEKRFLTDRVIDSGNSSATSFEFPPEFMTHAHSFNAEKEYSIPKYITRNNGILKQNEIEALQKEINQYKEMSAKGPINTKNDTYLLSLKKLLSKDEIGREGKDQGKGR